jgi:hypothetical protein
VRSGGSVVKPQRQRSSDNEVELASKLVWKKPTLIEITPSEMPL